VLGAFDGDTTIHREQKRRKKNRKIYKREAVGSKEKNVKIKIN
jgi:hypothetical protein